LPGRVGLAPLGPFHLKAMQNHKPVVGQCRIQRKKHKVRREKREKWRRSYREVIVDRILHHALYNDWLVSLKD